MKRAQSAIEFMILVGFMLFTFVVFLAVINGNMSDKIRERQNQRLYEIALVVRSEVDMAYGSIEGYSRSFVLPENLAGQDYSVRVSGGLVAVSTEDKKYSLALPLKNVTGTVVNGENQIKLEDGIVKINT